MVNIYTTIETYFEKENLEKLKILCLKNGLEFDHQDEWIWADEKCKSANKTFKYVNSDIAFVSGFCPPESIYRIFNEADFKIGVLIDG